MKDNSKAAPPIAKKGSNGSMAGAKRIGTNPTRKVDGPSAVRGHVGPHRSPYHSMR